MRNKKKSKTRKVSQLIYQNVNRMRRLNEGEVKCEFEKTGNISRGKLGKRKIKHTRGKRSANI